VPAVVGLGGQSGIVVLGVNLADRVDQGGLAEGDGCYNTVVIEVGEVVKDPGDWGDGDCALVALEGLLGLPFSKCPLYYYELVFAVQRCSRFGPLTAAPPPWE
jgi:hypothetical protein